jgi:hypothetical protein
MGEDDGSEANEKGQREDDLGFPDAKVFRTGLAHERQGTHERPAQDPGPTLGPGLARPNRPSGQGGDGEENGEDLQQTEQRRGLAALPRGGEQGAGRDRDQVPGAEEEVLALERAALDDRTAVEASAVHPSTSRIAATVPAAA